MAIRGSAPVPPGFIRCKIPVKFEKQRITPMLFTVYLAAASGRSPALPCLAAFLVLVRFSGLFVFTQFFSDPFFALVINDIYRVNYITPVVYISDCVFPFTGYIVTLTLVHNISLPLHITKQKINHIDLPYPLVIRRNIVHCDDEFRVIILNPAQRRYLALKSCRVENACVHPQRRQPVIVRYCLKAIREKFFSPYRISHGYMFLFSVHQ